METLCTISEMRDGTREIRYSREDFVPSFFVREQFYAFVPNETVERLKDSKKEEVQNILKTL